jgi:hypothetical protein
MWTRYVSGDSNRHPQIILGHPTSCIGLIFPSPHHSNYVNIVFYLVHSATVAEGKIQSWPSRCNALALYHGGCALRCQETANSGCGQCATQPSSEKQRLCGFAVVEFSPQLTSEAWSLDPVEVVSPLGHEPRLACLLSAHVCTQEVTATPNRQPCPCSSNVTGQTTGASLTQSPAGN